MVYQASLRLKNSKVDRLWRDNTKILKYTQWKTTFSFNEKLKKDLEKPINGIKK